MKHFSTEEFISASSTQIEDEVCFYAELTDPSILKGLPFEDHEQYEFKIYADRDDEEDCGILRFRKTTIGSESQVTRTIKTRALGDARIESSGVGTDEEFAQIKAVAKRGMLKRRFIMPIPDMQEVLEIDAFFHEDGTILSWMKIDIERKTHEGPLTAALLPECFTQAISAKTTDTKEREFIDELYGKHFCIKK